MSHLIILGTISAAITLLMMLGIYAIDRRRLQSRALFNAPNNPPDIEHYSEILALLTILAIMVGFSGAFLTSALFDSVDAVCDADRRCENISLMLTISACIVGAIVGATTSLIVLISPSKK